MSDEIDSEGLPIGIGDAYGHSPRFLDRSEDGDVVVRTYMFSKGEVNVEHEVTPTSFVSYSYSCQLYDQRFLRIESVSPRSSHWGISIFNHKRRRKLAISRPDQYSILLPSDTGNHLCALINANSFGMVLVRYGNDARLLEMQAVSNQPIRAIF